MKIIFLDIDGVLNCQTGFEKGLCKYNDDYGQDFYPPSSDLLNELIEKTNAKIVISSTWRHSGLAEMQAMWKHRKMAGEVIDITPSFYYIENLLYTHEEKIKPVKYRIPRGIEIDAWLEWKGFEHIFWSKELQQEYMDKSGIENYIIIDDDGDFLYKQRKNFVHVKPSPRNNDGFTKKHFTKTFGILNKNLIDLYYK